jgi:hypothetical protein
MEGRLVAFATLYKDIDEGEELYTENDRFERVHADRIERDR